MTDDTPFICAKCGLPFQIDEHGIANHVHAHHEHLPESERIDYDTDADHVPYQEEP